MKPEAASGSESQLRYQQHRRDLPWATGMPISLGNLKYHFPLLLKFLVLELVGTPISRRVVYNSSILFKEITLYSFIEFWQFDSWNQQVFQNYWNGFPLLLLQCATKFNYDELGTHNLITFYRYALELRMFVLRKMKFRSNLMAPLKTHNLAIDLISHLYISRYYLGFTFEVFYVLFV